MILPQQKITVDTWLNLLRQGEREKGKRERLAGR